MREAREAAVLAMGMFDGVHLGHRALIQHAVKRAKELGAKSVVYTFDAHPRSVFASQPVMLMHTQERLNAIVGLGVDEIYTETFDKAFAALSPDEFIELLLRRFDVKAMVAGFNYTFGVKGSGTPETLCALGGQYGFEAIVEPPVLFEGAPVSSTRIRACIEAGDIRAANTMLGQPYMLSGQIVRNRRIGSRIGFPTANILPPEGKALPKTGVYVTTAVAGDALYAAITNVGDNPTVQGDKITVETHLLDFEGDIYGEALCIQFHERVRDEKRFDDKNELACQIEKDAAHARAVLG